MSVSGPMKLLIIIIIIKKNPDQSNYVIYRECLQKISSDASKCCRVANFKKCAEGIDILCLLHVGVREAKEGKHCQNKFLKIWCEIGKMFMKFSRFLNDDRYL